MVLTTTKNIAAVVVATFCESNEIRGSFTGSKFHFHSFFTVAAGLLRSWHFSNSFAKNLTSRTTYVDFSWQLTLSGNRIPSSSSKRVDWRALPVLVVHITLFVQ